jgi:subtilisin-like proprotein convertase family protein
VLAAKAFQESATLGRGGKGTIFVWAGGNGRLDGDNSNYDGYANSIHTIAVGAVDDRGRVSDYSEPGANLVVVAPSDTGWYTSFRQGIATTDLVGDQGLNAEGLVNDVATVYGYPSDFPNASYTKIMGGTSSATPIAAGVIALILEANPQLGWRDVQAILIKTATKVSPSHRDWIVNGAGQPFNHDFGAGLINAEAAVTLAKTWKLLPKQQSIVREETALSLRIPDNQAAGLTRSYAVSSNLRVEHVTVTVDLQHENRGQLEVLLTSPSGTVSRLAEVHQDDGDDYKWTFMTVRNWGESAQGTWRLTVRDRVSGTVGTLKSVRLTVLGSSL